MSDLEPQRTVYFRVSQGLNHRESLFILFYFTSLWTEARSCRTPLFWLVLFSACFPSLHNLVPALPPTTILLPFAKPLTPHECPFLLSCSYCQAPVLGMGNILLQLQCCGQHQKFLFFNIHAGFPGEINQPRASGSGGICVFSMHSHGLGFGLWEQLGENWPCLDFQVSGGDAVFKHQFVLHEFAQETNTEVNRLCHIESWGPLSSACLPVKVNKSWQAPEAQLHWLP